MKTEDKMSRMIIGYNRISTLKQSDGTSLKHQEQKIREYCQLKDLQVSEIYSEIDTFNLAKLGKRAIELIVKQNINVFFTYVTKSEIGKWVTEKEIAD